MIEIALLLLQEGTTENPAPSAFGATSVPSPGLTLNVASRRSSGLD